MLWYWVKATKLKTKIKITLKSIPGLYLNDKVGIKGELKMFWKPNLTLTGELMIHYIPKSPILFTDYWSSENDQRISKKTPGSLIISL